MRMSKLWRVYDGSLQNGFVKLSVQSSSLSSPAVHHSFRTYSTHHTSRPPTISTSDVLSEQLRTAMRLLTHPVVVLSALDKSTTTTTTTMARAMTMSSFTSLSLDPTPLVSFNVRTPSRTLEALRASGEFEVRLLRGDERGREVAERLARGNVLVSWGGDEIEEGGVLACLKCRVFEEEEGAKGLVQVRDHVIVVGEVVEVVTGEDSYGLAYSDRAYRRIGEVISGG